MAEPLLYSKPTLDSDRAVQLFGESLYKRPELAKHVRELMTSPESTIDSLLSGARTNNGFRPIPWVLPNLRASGGVLFASISPERQLMLHRPPPSLVTLLLQCQSHCQCGADRCGQQCVQGRFCLDGSVFNNLPHLEHLSICGCIVREPQDTLSVSHALPRLKRIHLRLHPGQNWAVQCLSLMQYVAFNDSTFLALVAHYAFRSDYLRLRRCFCECTLFAISRRASCRTSSRCTARNSDTLISKARSAHRTGRCPCSTTVPMSGRSRSMHPTRSTQPLT